MNSLTVTPAGAANAYARIQDGSGPVAGTDAGSGFGAAAQQDKLGAGLRVLVATAIRDRVVSAYQDIMRMPI